MHIQSSPVKNFWLCKETDGSVSLYLSTYPPAWHKGQWREAAVGGAGIYVTGLPAQEFPGLEIKNSPVIARIDWMNIVRSMPSMIME